MTMMYKIQKIANLIVNIVEWLYNVFMYEMMCMVMIMMMLGERSENKSDDPFHAPVDQSNCYEGWVLPFHTSRTTFSLNFFLSSWSTLPAFPLLSTFYSHQQLMKMQGKAAWALSINFINRWVVEWVQETEWDKVMVPSLDKGVKSTYTNSHFWTASMAASWQLKWKGKGYSVSVL